MNVNEHITIQIHFSSKKGMMGVAKAFPGFRKAVGMAFFILFTLFANAQYPCGAAYVRSTVGAPWGVTTNEQAMNMTFGASNWDDLRFETVNVSILFSNAYRFIFLEGGDNNSDELEAFLAANGTLLENWVANGGSLILNAAPNEGNGMSYGFGGVQLIYPTFIPNVNSPTPGHPIFAGPNTPVTTAYTGNWYGHAILCPAGLGATVLIHNSVNNTEHLLVEASWGAGTVFFGGMTTTNFHTPQPEALNLRANMLSYLSGLGCIPVDITCPPQANLSGCSVDDIDFGGTLGTFSSVPKSITEAEFITLGGTITPGVPPYNISYQDVAVSSCPIIVTRTFTITDDANTTDNCTQIITVDDDVFPTIDCPNDIHIYLGSGECETQVYWSIDADDNCSEPVLMQTGGFPSGSIFDKDFSPYTIAYKATDACNNMTTCSFDIYIHDNVPDENSLSCGDQINVSMDEDCQFYFTADYLLTGNDYHCYDDYDTYVMECHNCPPIPTSPIITPEYIGDTLVGKVCDPLTGICCWGYIVPEDKGDPSLCCADFSMSCTADTDPGSISGIKKTYSYSGPPIAMQDIDTVELTIDVECDTLPIIDLVLSVNISHTNTAHLSATLYGPDDTPYPFTIPTPAYPVPPAPPTNASGTWTIVIIDNTTGSVGTVFGASLEIEADYANPIPIDNCDSDMTTSYTDVISDPNCDGDCYQTIIRTWCVTDDSGNEYCCDQTICLTRPSLDDLVCPPDYDGMDQPMLSCNGGFPTDQNGHPDPSHTGRPELEGFEVDGFCMLYCIYEDDSIGVCEGSYIIVREWECFDWCEGTDTTCTQVIKVMDNEGPNLVCPDTITLNAGYDCTAGTTLPPPNLTDLCSPSGVGYSAFLSSGGGDLVFSGGNWILSNVPIGTTTICYAAYDGCENRDTCYFDVIVTDNTPPVAICETYHTVGIAGSPSWYNAIDFDDGSYDYCSPITYEVKRLTNPNCLYPDGQETAFGPKVPFYCCDVGDTIEVILKITDAGNLMNFCTSYVTVQDNVAPTHIDCPDEVEVDCTLDFYNPDNTGGEPTFLDNCGIDTIIITFTNPQLNCGRDTLYKKWLAIDKFGNKDSCEQTIIVVNNDPFDGTTDIDWPEHVIVPPISCESSTHPDSLPIGSQRPILLTNNACDIVSIADPEDLIFYPVDPETADFCYKIKRTWEIIDWCFIDGTGNPAIYEYEQIIKVVDEEPPTFTCPDDITAGFGDPINVVVTNIDDNCTNPLNITVTYDIDQGANGSFEIIGQAGPDASGQGGDSNYPEGTNLVRFILTDGCYQSDTCFVEVLITNGPPTFNVSGGIENEEGNEVEYVDVEVEGDNMNDITTTGDDGTYSFNLQSNSNYAITPERDDNILNGVSTYDLVLISKHILQYELLSTPYKIIAADVNHSGSISTLDMVALRRVILFIDDEFPNNTSWRFVDAEFVFPDPTDPFATSFPEVFTINGLTGDEVANFVGVKIGDVNISSAPNDLIGSGDDRNADGELIFTLADQSLIAGETYQFEFEATDFDQVQGFQFTMSYNENAIEFNDVEAGDLANISDASFGLHKLNEGIITASWNASDESQTLENGKVLFSLSFTALEDGQLSELININSRFTKAEAYNHKGLLDLSLQFADESGTIAAEQFELYQNQPNPFKDETVIGFYLPESGKATFKVFDISGRVIKSVAGNYSKGYSEISINRSELQSSGVLYYQLESAEHIASKKMVLLD